MSYPNSVEEIDIGMTAEGLDDLLNSGDELAIAEYKLRQEFFSEQRKTERLSAHGYGYYLDNCWDEVDGDSSYYCKRCLQPECCKRLARRIIL